MAENTAIEWADHTFNPWEGCQKVGPGCDHCYAETRNARFGGGTASNWGPGAPRRRTGASNWAKPLRWQREAAAFMQAHGRRQRVFCSSLADVFDNAVDPTWRDDLWKLIAATPDLDWLLLTKRIGNVANMLPVSFDFDRMYPNVWLGATIVNQLEWDRDARKIAQVRVAAGRRVFLSIEPMLGPIRLDTFSGWAKIVDWVICGGESGPGARPMHPDWARSLRDQCAAAGVPFLFKQWGEWLPAEPWYEDHPVSLPVRGWRAEGWTDDGQVCADDPGYVARIGKKAAGRLLDGVTHDGVPA